MMNGEQLDINGPLEMLLDILQREPRLNTAIIIKIENISYNSHKQGMGRCPPEFIEDKLTELKDVMQNHK